MPLQKPFRGLSDVLGRFEGGTIPFELDQGLKATLDVEKFLMEPRWTFTSTSNAHGIGFRSSITIPENEVWLLYHIGGLSTIPIAAANTIGIMPVYQHQSVEGKELPLSDFAQFNSFLNCATGTYASFSWNYPGGLWVMDGAIGYIVQQRTGIVNIQMDWGFQVAKFKR